MKSKTKIVRVFQLLVLVFFVVQGMYIAHSIIQHHHYLQSLPDTTQEMYLNQEILKWARQQNISVIFDENYKPFMKVKNSKELITNFEEIKEIKTALIISVIPRERINDAFKPDLLIKYYLISPAGIRYYEDYYIAPTGYTIVKYNQNNGVVILKKDVTLGWLRTITHGRNVLVGIVMLFIDVTLLRVAFPKGENTDV